jgi:DNA invertase Pin-like site-specific DNA recombinase
MTIYGYARVSTADQSLDGQLAELKEAGCTKVFQEKVTGKHRDRPQLERLLKKLEPGDVLIVTRLDRLARSTRDLLNLIHQIGEAGASFKSLKDSWADTTHMHGDHHLVKGGEPPKEGADPMTETYS